MIDTEQMAKEFIERRKAYNQCNNLKPGDKDYLDENPQLLLITYKDGKGGMVIDQESLSKLSKGVQTKIFNMHKI